ncbi:MAG TPA: rhodanese-like domain-containing protein [Vicinamibacteria bacterium]|nr:rhodanese-like domain-containing protein [Vicinamibacteria bacterium]
MRAWRLAFILALGFALGLAWNAWSGRGIALQANAFIAPGETIEEIPASEARRRLDQGALFLDARPLAFYEMEHVPGALPLPEDDFEASFARIEPRLRSSFDIVVYCSGYGCEASHKVTRALRAKGVAAVILNEGWPAWTDAGYPVREGKQP